MTRSITPQTVQVRGASVPAVDWHKYEAWVRTQLGCFRELCAHPEPVAG
jgi:hypothetical protein